MDLKFLEAAPPWEWPEGTDRFLLEILRDDQAAASDRILAADLAGDYVVINDELAGALVSILKDQHASEEQRSTAAISLGPVLEHVELYGFEDSDDVPISEGTFRNIQDTLGKLYLDDGVPKSIRRSILEASVRAPQDWHHDAVRAAYASEDEDWRLTAVFAMRWVRGFAPQILEALESSNPDIHYQAVCAAGNWGVDEAWAHVSKLLRNRATDKPLLLAAIDAAVGIRPNEAGMLLVDLSDADDEDIVDAADEAMAMVDGFLSDDMDRE